MSEKASPISSTVAAKPTKAIPPKEHDDDAESDDGDDDDEEEEDSSILRKLEEMKIKMATNPIFHACRISATGKKTSDETKEQLAETLGGKRLIEGAWYFGFTGAHGKKTMAALRKAFGEPVGQEVLEHYRKQKKQQEQLSDMKALLKMTMRAQAKNQSKFMQFDLAEVHGRRGQEVMTRGRGGGRGGGRGRGGRLW